MNQPLQGETPPLPTSSFSLRTRRVAFHSGGTSNLLFLMAVCRGRHIYVHSLVVGWWLEAYQCIHVCTPYTATPIEKRTVQDPLDGAVLLDERQRRLGADAADVACVWWGVGGGWKEEVGYRWGEGALCVPVRMRARWLGTGRNDKRRKEQTRNANAPQ